MTTEILIAQLKATQASALALAANVEAILQSLATRVDTPTTSPPQTPQPPLSPSDLDPNSVCIHPPQMRQSAAAMGAPKRYWCQLCEQMIEPDKPEETK